MIGQTISHYKILEKIGQGGMGEVYRAEDTNLSREVAIKVLPEQFTQDPQRLARFEREAKLLASLNHPNIAAIYGLEEAGGVRFLALELVEGETLADLLTKGPVPVGKTLELCRQIAEGVEAAHEKGVIHRDLKPANVKLTPEGKVKILDFGLAKAFEGEVPVADISQSPTLTEEMTRAGVILGTAAYMSPEQARGEEVDKRTDIFAFGCVLYDLLTGKRAFDGKTVTDTLAKVLEGEPDWKALPETTPGIIRSLLRRSLQKQTSARFQNIADARILIEDALAEPATVPLLGVSGAVQTPLWKRAIPWTIAVAIVVVTGLAFWSSTRPGPAPLTEFMIAPLSNAPLAQGAGNDLAISPDGRRIVYRAVGETGGLQLYLRSLDNVEATAIQGTQGASADFFFSPDGDSVAFAVGGQLKKVSLTGGPPTTLCSVAAYRGGSWSADNTIVFAALSDAGRGLYRISATGGEPEVLTIADSEKGEVEYRAPEILPGGEAVLFEIYGGTVANSWVANLSLTTGEQAIMLEGARQARYASTGHLVYASAATGTLMVVAFDLNRLEVTGSPVPFLEGIRQDPNAAADYSLSNGGTLVYVPSGESNEYSLVWVNRQGGEERVTQEKGDYLTPRVSPDGRQIALTRGDDSGSRHVWIYDIASDSFSRLTFDGTANSRPVWSPDGQWIAFASNRGGGPRQVYRKPADGSGQIEPLVTDPEFTGSGPNSYSPDGSVLVFRAQTASDPADIWILPMEDDQDPQLLISSPNIERGAALSPDGRWVAYGSTEMDQFHVYVSPYDEPDVKWLVSGLEGGAEPIWAPDASELFYRNLTGDRMMAVPVETQPTFSAGRPRVVFEGFYRNSTLSPGYPYYDITPDGQRFLMIRREHEVRAQISVVLNWFEELKRLVPAN